ncbi:MAG TPA: SDR family oxidoreductase [Chitinophagales bacterium]|nr:SDR family oxidoreductase [Chitinophagales bacterium]
MKDKIVLITGGNAGIGFATAEALANKGAELLIAARNEQKLNEAVQQLKTKTGNHKIRYYVADFSSQKSVRNLAAQVRKEYDKIDVLINNAGGTFSEFKLTEDGLETTIATNHFAYFLLTNLLLDLIKKSDYARIVNVASGSHYQGKIDFDSFKQNKGYFIMKAYAQSKLANVLFTFELAERLKDTNVTANCLHPGMVNTDIGNKYGTWYSKLLWTLASHIGGISIEKGAETSVYLASSDEVKGVTGKYFDKCKQKDAAALARDKQLQKELWRVSEQLCPLD